MKKKKNQKPLVGIVMGSESDLSVMREAAEALKAFEIPYSIQIVSAHRTPREVATYADHAAASGIRVIIAGAGGAAHLPGMVAAHTHLPVIGVPVPIGALKGMDALLSIVQMPKGIPVATVAIGNAWNAGVLAAQILASSNAPALSEKLLKYKSSMRKKVLATKVSS